MRRLRCLRAGLPRREAIYYEDDVPEQWSAFTAANVEFLRHRRLAGGAAKMGVIDTDHAVVTALPPQAEGH